jgi:hypothetical protein
MDINYAKDEDANLPTNLPSYLSELPHVPFAPDASNHGSKEPRIRKPSFSKLSQTFI